MDTLDFYRDTIKAILDRYASIPYKYGTIEQSVVTDAPRNNFFLINIGWKGGERIHGIVTHVQIIDDKIWIQRDGLEDGVTVDLEAAGIPKDKIVLAFYPPHVRPHTGYAIA
jgi:hypothetical protein